MLPARHRLRSARDFTAAVRGGRRSGTPLLVAHVVTDPTPGPAPVRVGVAVGRAVGPAVVRNRVKRRLRHLLRDRLGVLPPGSRCVVRANPSAATASSATLGAALDSALARASRNSRDG